MFTNAQVRLVDVQVRDGNGNPTGPASRPPYVVMTTRAAMTAGLNPYVFTPGSLDDGWAGQETIYLLFDTEDEMRAALAEHLDGWGKELVSIENDSNWSYFDTDVGFVGGKMAINEMEGDTDSAVRSLSTPLSPHVAVLTVLEITDYTDGMVCVVVGGVEGTWRSAAGTYEEIITPGSGSSNDVRLSYAGNTTLSVARLSARARIVEAPAETMGPELVTNGGFDDPSGWSTGDPDVCYISGGKLILNDPGSDYGFVSMQQYALTATPGATYRVTFDLEAGQARVSFGGVVATYRVSPSTYTEDIVATNSGALLVAMSGAAIVDNVSLKRVL